ncbi:MAG: Crp/Fnr family transcriptional regulator [Sporomusaceae bacterium]|nr:Crp/Fnr family transcriptional regulator [Sporomusaceae bacterium]
MALWDFLKNIPVFEELGETELALIAELTVTRNYKKSMIIFMEGEPGEGFYYVKSGKVKIVQASSDGREHIINILGPGEVFAEALLFRRGGYPATAVALEDSVIGMIQNKELEKAVMSHPTISLHIIKVLTQKLLNAQMKIKTLAFSDTYVRTGQNLAKLARQYGKPTKAGVEIDLDMTRQDLANLVGTSRETVTRALGSLKKERTIDLIEHKIIILDMDKLENSL